MLPESLATLSFLLLLIVGSILPSDGNHGVLAPKSLCFLSAGFFFILYYLSRGGLKASQAKASLFVLFSLTFLSFWYIVGINQDPQIPSGQFDQFKVFLTTLFVPIAGIYYVKEELLTPKKILRAVIYANFAYALMKVALMFLHVIGVINVWTFMHNTGLRFMSMHILGDVGRIQTSIDILTPYLLFFVLQSDRLDLGFSKKFKWSFYFVAAISIFLSFSRLLIFAGLLSLILHGITLGFRSQVKLWVALFFALIAGGIAVGPEKVEKVIEKRLFSNDNRQSDATRRVQIEAMMRSCDQNPLLGNGLGGYTKECIRDHALPHAYEVQWVAFLMQFGSFGLLFLLIPVGMIFWQFVTPPQSRIKWGYFTLFSLWIVSGLTNPFMISLTSGIVYFLFILAGEMENKRRLYIKDGNS